MQKILKIVLPAVILFFLVLSVLKDWNNVVDQLKFFNPLFLIISFILMLLIYPEAGLCWHIILGKMGIKNNLRSSLYVWIISTTSRYIPGTIWQYIGRIELAKKVLGLKREVTVISLLFEVFLVIIAAGLISVYIVTILPAFRNFINYWYLLFLAPLILFHPFFTNKFLRLLAKVMNKPLESDIKNLGLFKTFSILPYFLLNFFLNGLALFFLILSATTSGSIPNILQLSSIYSLSWLIGFVTIFAPAGLGVMEASLAYMLSLYYPASFASFIALAYRLMLILAEVIVFLIALRLTGKNGTKN